MKITIVAASGGVGRQLLDQALHAGHDVTAVVRSASRLARQVPTVQVDLAAPDGPALESAVAGADAVLSALGARSGEDRGIAERGTRAIVDAMHSSGRSSKPSSKSRRLIVVSAAPVSTVASPARPQPPRSDPDDGFLVGRLLTPLIKLALRTTYADLARMEDVLRASDLDWTVVRPPRLTDGPATGTYRTAVDRNLRRGLSVSRADVAHLMLRAIEQPETIGRAVRIAS